MAYIRFTSHSCLSGRRYILVIPSVMIYKPLPADQSEMIAVIIVVPDVARLIAFCIIPYINTLMSSVGSLSYGMSTDLFPNRREKRETENMMKGTKDSMMKNADCAAIADTLSDLFFCKKFLT